MPPDDRPSDTTSGASGAPTQNVDTFAAAHEAQLPAWLARNRWLIYVLPLLVFMLVNQFEPTPPEPADPIAAGAEDAADESTGGGLALDVPYEYYPYIYTLKIVLTLAAMVLVWPGYRQHSFRVGPLAIGVGVVGVFIWIGLCSLRLEERLLGPLGLDGVLGLGQRSAFNPLDELAGQPAWAWGFLAIRFFGLVVVVAVIEEFFLRGFLMRFVVQDAWWNVPFGSLHWGGIVLATVAAVSMHPAEMFAELVWFSTVTWLMLRTRNIWDCVAAHATTNLLLGLYVVGSDFYGLDRWHLM